VSPVCFGTPTLYADLGRGDLHQLETVLAAVSAAGCSSISVFGSHLVQAIEFVVHGRLHSLPVPPADRRAAIGAFRAALLRAPRALTFRGADVVQDLFHRAHIEVNSIECLTLWPGADSQIAIREAQAAAAIATRFDAKQVVAVCLEPAADQDALRSGLDLVAGILGAHGLDVVVEWLPGSGLASIGETIRLIEAVDRPNVGLVLDALHWQCQRGGPDWSALDRASPRLIRQLQLSDCAVPVAADVLEPRNRLLPGHGDIDLTRLLQTVHSMGAQPTVTCEVFDEPTLMAVGAHEFARRQADAARAVLAAASPVR
jgi:sugar phosphate isomerase/epimerase